MRKKSIISIPQIYICVWVMSLFISVDCLAQKSDSVKYEYGFLHFHEYGKTVLPAILLLTGGPGNSYTQLEEVAIQLSKTYRVILPEQRGTGQSIPTPFDSTTVNVEAVTNDLALLLKHVSLKQVVVIGHSWGAMLAMSFAAKYPEKVKHLILVTPGPHKDIKSAFEILFGNREHILSQQEQIRSMELNERMAAGAADSSEMEEAKRLFRRPYVFAKPIPDSVYTKINVPSNSQTANLLWKEMFAGNVWPSSLSNYSGPVDVISGRQDFLAVCSYEIKLEIPRTNLHWINRCGHFPMYEKPQQFYSILGKILNNVE